MKKKSCEINHTWLLSEHPSLLSSFFFRSIVLFGSFVEAYALYLFYTPSTATVPYVFNIHNKISRSELVIYYYWLRCLFNRHEFIRTNFVRPSAASSSACLSLYFISSGNYTESLLLLFTLLLLLLLLALIHRCCYYYYLRFCLYAALFYSLDQSVFAGNSRIDSIRIELFQNMHIF